MHPTDIKTAADFTSFMAEVWRMDTQPAADGGLSIIGSPLYDEWSDARKAVEAAGATRRWGYRFDGHPGFARVAIATDGSAGSLFT